MAAKKRPSKPATRLRPSSARLKSPGSVKAPLVAPPASAPEVVPVQTTHYGPIILAVVVVVGLGWWALKPKSTDTATAPAPVFATPIPASDPTSVPAPAAAQAAAAQAAPVVHHKHEHSYAEILTFKAGKTWSVRCWRSADSPASLGIFGRRNVHVRTVYSDPGAAGWLTLSWDGMDDKGALVPKGEYYALPSQKNEEVILDLRVKN
jgi:FlgD Ig-like domain